MKKIFTLLFVLFLSACTTQNQNAISPEANAPAPGFSDSDLKQILNVLQAEVQQRQNVNVNLTTHYFKMAHNWAYIETIGGGDPSINAILVKANNKWKLAKSTHSCQPVCPVGMSSCSDGELICKNTLHQQFPNAPVSIFPSSSAHNRVYNY